MFFKRYLKWINNMKDLKTVKTDVPSGIIPSRYSKFHTFQKNNNF
jgi:hypothetical protein